MNQAKLTADLGLPRENVVRESWSKVKEARIGREKIIAVILGGMLLVIGSCASEPTSFSCHQRYMEQRFQEAIDCYSERLKQDPANTRLLVSKGLALLKIGQPAKALDAYRRALKIEPTHGAARWGIRQGESQLSESHETSTTWSSSTTEPPEFDMEPREAQAKKGVSDL